MPHSKFLAPTRYPVRVVHVITGLEVGGAERMLVRLVSTSDPHRFRHSLLTLTAGGSLVERLAERGIAVRSLGIARGQLAPAALFRAISWLRAERPDVVQTWLYHADLLGLLAARVSTRARVAWNLRCSDMDLSRYGRLTRLVVRALARLSACPDLVISNSVAGRDWHRHLGYRPRHWEIIPNGVDPTLFRPDIDARARWRHQLNIAPDQLAVGLIARRDPMKDQDGFLVAAARAAARRPDLVFVLAGRGVDTDTRLAELGRAVSAPVHLLPQCDDVPGLMAGLDLLAMSSRFGEGFPNVVAEAMACGLPTAVTNVGDAAAIVEDTGIVVPPGDPQAMAEAIATLASDPVRRHRLGVAARQRILEHFTLSNVTARYEAVYERLAAGDSPCAA